jgi:hypothetical protein
MATSKVREGFWWSVRSQPAIKATLILKIGVRTRLSEDMIDLNSTRTTAESLIMITNTHCKYVEFCSRALVSRSLDPSLSIRLALKSLFKSNTKACAPAWHLRPRPSANHQRSSKIADEGHLIASEVGEKLLTKHRWPYWETRY